MHAARCAALLAAITASAPAQTFDELAKFYRYDRSAPLNFEQKEMEARGGYKLYSVRFDLPKRGHVSGYLVAPASTDSGHDIDDISAMTDRARFLARNLRLPGIEGVLRAKLGRP